MSKPWWNRPEIVLVLCTLLILVPLNGCLPERMDWPDAILILAASLYAIAFMSRQIGGFLSVWLAGVIRGDVGNYDTWWWVIIAAGAVAALLHYPIDETHTTEPAGELA